MKVGREKGCDYRVAGHDNQPLSAYTCPPLTTVSQDCRRMGEVALDMLLAVISGERQRDRLITERILLNGEFVFRRST